MRLFIFLQRQRMRTTGWRRMTEQRWSPPRLRLLRHPPSPPLRLTSAKVGNEHIKVGGASTAYNKSVYQPQCLNRRLELAFQCAHPPVAMPTRMQLCCKCQIQAVRWYQRLGLFFAGELSKELHCKGIVTFCFSVWFPWHCWEGGRWEVAQCWSRGKKKPKTYYHKVRDHHESQTNSAIQ